MPIGVEHNMIEIRRLTIIKVSLPVMPIGVEHESNSQSSPGWS